MIFITKDDYDIIRVFEGPDVDLAELDYSLRRANHDAMNEYEKEYPRPSDPLDLSDWRKHAPLPKTIQKWLLSSGYTEIKYKLILC